MSHGHAHGPGGTCKCLEAPVPLQQSLEEVAFEKGLWGYILRGANASQVQSMILEREKNASSQGHSLTRQAIVNEADKAGYTPLLYAARQGSVEVCEVLIREGADVNAATPGLGQSVLHRAAMQGHSSVVELLLKCGADLTVMDQAGKTPFDFAQEKGHSEVVRLLTAATTVKKIG